MNVPEKIPFVLRQRTLLPAGPAPGPDQRYDTEQQLWVTSDGAPLVAELARRQGEAVRSSKFGETTMTKTSEGTDQSEAVGASAFGETVASRTAEGHDQSEVSASTFGETITTATGEGTDQTERSSGPSKFGETLMTETREGVDQSEAIS